MLGLSIFSTTGEMASMLTHYTDKAAGLPGCSPIRVLSKQPSKVRSPKMSELLECKPPLSASSDLRHSMQSMRARATC